ncbi:hypothetical protein F5Y05DRAFT_181049 [Hypoxylon sp. FL0543]|nr:hypothetical protein F5Y05DRAFT_181049 [Hypoxylon sp. FL0543]
MRCNVACGAQGHRQSCWQLRWVLFFSPSLFTLLPRLGTGEFYQTDPSWINPVILRAIIASGSQQSSPIDGGRQQHDGLGCVFEDSFPGLSTLMAKVRILSCKKAHHPPLS